MGCMCGPTSAIGLADEERAHWPWLRERLRVPDQCMGLMRAVLGSDAEVAAVVATDTRGVSRALAVVATPVIVTEIALPDLGVREDDVVIGHIGDDDVAVLIPPGSSTPAAMLITPWMREHLYLYARQLWWPRRRSS